MPKNSLNTKKTQFQTKAKNYALILDLLKEFELAYNLAPELTKAQIQQLKLLLNQIVKEKKE